MAVIVALVAVMLSQPLQTPGATAIGSYRFGMTREQVAGVTSCRPYLPVNSTGGLECRNFLLGTRRMTISFIFSGKGLTRVQLWFYDGQSLSDAREATSAMLAYLSTLGRVRSSEVGGPVTTDAILSKLQTMSREAKSGQAARVQVLTTGRSKAPFAHGSVTVARTGFYVFAFLSDSQSGQPRH